MKLASIRTPAGPRAVRIDDDRLVDLGAPDLGVVFDQPGWFSRCSSADRTLELAATVNFAPVVPRPSKIICVGLNYRAHILETGAEVPEFPTLFAKFADALCGANDAIALPPESAKVDWEGELAVIIGQPIRRADVAGAEAAIGGFTILNDVSMRDWQRRTSEWLQGKSFEGVTPCGPVMVTPDELPGSVRPALQLTVRVDDEVVQQASTADLVFDPVTLVQYISQFTTLRAGDIISTGTPAGVGNARKPPRYLTSGSTMVTEIQGIGRMTNAIVA